MFRQVAFLAILAAVFSSGCYVDKDRGAETKFQAGGEPEQADIKTFYVASVAAGIDTSTGKFVNDSYTGKFVNDSYTGEFVDGSQTIFLTRIDYNDTT